MDREWPVAINVDQPKLLPLLQSDRVGSERGFEIASVCYVCLCLLAKEREMAVCWAQG